ncbi:MAG: hypothetical protein MUQ51_07570 [Pseudomonadota bacterium]|nr:hypothetical protein [Pseudomonadota bacterium]MDO7711460.1 hypothetical protein [Pseudomonadota bacterium]
MSHIIQTNRLSWFIVESEEKYGYSEPPYRVALHVDNILDLIDLYKQDPGISIKGVYIITESDEYESENLVMRKVSSIWTGIDRRYKHTLHFCLEEGNNTDLIYLDSLDDLKRKDVIHTRQICTFPSPRKDA